MKKWLIGCLTVLAMVCLIPGIMLKAAAEHRAGGPLRAAGQPPQAQGLSCRTDRLHRR